VSCWLIYATGRAVACEQTTSFEGISNAPLLGEMEGSCGPGHDLLLPELPAALAPHRLGVGVLHFDDVMAVWRRAPL
jgi:hypothetical protein